MEEIMPKDENTLKNDIGISHVNTNNIVNRDIGGLVA